MSHENKIPFLRNFSPGMNLMSLFSIVFMGYVFAAFFVFLVVKPLWGLNIFEYNEEFTDLQNQSVLNLNRFIIIVSTIFVFITPATIFRRFIEYQGQDYLVVRKKPKLKWLIVVAMLFVVCFPVSNFLLYINHFLDISAISKETGDVIKAAEVSDGEYQAALLVNGNFTTYLINLLSIAVLTAIGEEFVFRGIVLRILIKLFRNIHLAIIAAAAIFSLTHFSYYGFLPIFFMGIVLGYIYLATANIWYCILFHCLNNAIAVTFGWLMGRGHDIAFYDSFGKGDIDKWVGLVLFLVLVGFAIMQIKKLINKEFVEEIKEF